MCALFRAVGFWVGRLNAKIDLKCSEMVGNESKINKRNNNFDNCSLFLISIRHMIKKNHHEYLRLDREWHKLNLMKSGGKSPLSNPPPLRGACLVPCTGHTSVCHSATDANEGYVLVSKSSIFRTLFPRLWKPYTVVYISWQRFVLFYIDHLSQESSESWFQSCCMLQQRAKPGIILLQPRTWIWRCQEINIYIRILLRTSPVYWILAVLTILKKLFEITRKKKFTRITRLIAKFGLNTTYRIWTKILLILSISTIIDGNLSRYDSWERESLLRCFVTVCCPCHLWRP